MLFRLVFLEKIFFLVCSIMKHPSDDRSISNTLWRHSWYLKRIVRVSSCLLPATRFCEAPLTLQLLHRRSHLTIRELGN